MKQYQSIRVTFLKRFTSGNLIGIEFLTTLHFNNSHAARTYIAFLVDHEAVPVRAYSSSDYTCHNPRMERVEMVYADLGSL